MIITFANLKKILNEKIIEMDQQGDLLLEPDISSDEDEQLEMSVAGAIAGYTLPLGAAQTDLNKKHLNAISHSSFGGNPKKRRRYS